ncbi:MAG: DUF4416 family protein [SAR324 cluster bacterium]|nr:DUF4416 family protein [SAR324 cluster bacterium]
MADINDEAAPSVKLFAAILYRDLEWLEQGLERLQGRFGPLDFRGPARRFDFTEFYAAEMGSDLSRCLVGFARLTEPPFLVEAKWQARTIETELAGERGRRVNIDVGYLDLFKVVLASFKGRGNKLYLGREVWADITLTYGKGKFQPLPWSFPDFKAGAYDDDLLELRRIFKAALKQRGADA